MNRILGAAFLVAVLGSGCVISGGGSRPGDVTFQWTFVGAGCAANPDVRWVRVQIPGEALADNGYYPCSTAGAAGIRLHDFVAGSYSFTLEALADNDDLLFVASGTFVVNGDITVHVDMTPVGQGTSFSYLNWSFKPNWHSGNPSCTLDGENEIDTVEVRIDEGPTVLYNCADGSGSSHVQTVLMSPGAHTIELLAVMNDFVVASKVIEIDARAHAADSHSVLFDWEIGGTVVAWRLSATGNSDQTCVQAGVDELYVYFHNLTTDEWPYGHYDDFEGDYQPCAEGNKQIAYYYLYPGNYEVLMEGVHSSAPEVSLYLSPAEGSAPTFSVTAGVFVPQDTTTPVNVVLTEL